MEQLDFTVQNNYKITQLNFNWSNSTMDIVLTDAFGKTLTCSYNGATATTLMNALNVGNFSAKSLHKTAFEYLIATGKVPAGTIGGLP